MARLALKATAGATTATHAALEELITTFAAALATLVADGASPTQAHVTAVNDAWTPINAVLGNDFVVYYNRSTVTPALLQTAFNATRDQTRYVA